MWNTQQIRNNGESWILDIFLNNSIISIMWIYISYTCNSIDYKCDRASTFISYLLINKSMKIKIFSNF